MSYKPYDDQLTKYLPNKNLKIHQSWAAAQTSWGALKVDALNKASLRVQIGYN